MKLQRMRIKMKGHKIEKEVNELQKLIQQIKKIDPNNYIINICIWDKLSLYFTYL